jgi:hypothetical protein
LNAQTAALRVSDERIGEQLNAEVVHINSQLEALESRSTAALRSQAALTEEADQAIRQALSAEVADRQDDTLSLSEAIAQSGKRFDEHRAALRARLDDIDTHHTYERVALEHRLAPTSIVQWRVDRKEFDAADVETGLTSGFFHAGGVRDLQLRVKYDGSRGDFLETGQPTPTDLSLTLIAPAGYKIVFAFLGGEGRKMKRVVAEHTFTGRERDEFEFPGFCNANLIAPDHRALTLGVEVLEASMAVPYWQGKWADHLDPRPEEARNATSLALQLAVPSKPKKIASDAFLWSKRTVSQHRFERIEKDVDAMKQRYTKRVEWRIEHAKRVQAEYPPGRELQSPLFSMAGLQDLQFIIHPNSSADGFCAMFVSAPPGTTIRGSLVMGDQKRSLKHEWDKREPIGRANMCLWQQAIDDSDCITVALEVESAQYKANRGDRSDGYMRQFLATPTSTLEDVRSLGTTRSMGLHDPDASAISMSQTSTALPKLEKPKRKRHDREKGFNASASFPRI